VNPTALTTVLPFAPSNTPASPAVSYSERKSRAVNNTVREQIKVLLKALHFRQKSSKKHIWAAFEQLL
jgi:hypothetical protein